MRDLFILVFFLLTILFTVCSIAASFIGTPEQAVNFVVSMIGSVTIFAWLAITNPRG